MVWREADETDELLLYTSDAELGSGSDDGGGAGSESSARRIGPCASSASRVRRTGYYAVVGSALLAMLIVAGVAVEQRQVLLKPAQSMETQEALVSLMSHVRGLMKKASQDSSSKSSKDASAKSSQTGNAKSSKASSQSSSKASTQLPKASHTGKSASMSQSQSSLKMQQSLANSASTQMQPCATVAPLSTANPNVWGKAWNRTTASLNKPLKAWGKAWNKTKTMGPLKALRTAWSQARKAIVVPRPASTVTTTPLSVNSGNGAANTPCSTGVPTMNPNPCGVIPHLSTVMKISNLSFSTLAQRFGVMVAMTTAIKKSVAKSGSVSPDNVVVGLKAGSVIVSVDVAPSVSKSATDLMKVLQPTVCKDLATALNAMPMLVQLASGYMSCQMLSISVTGPPSTTPAAGVSQIAYSYSGGGVAGTLKLRPTDTVQSVIALIRQTDSLPPNQQLLVYDMSSSKQLIGTKTLGDYGLGQGSKIGVKRVPLPTTLTTTLRTALIKTALKKGGAITTTLAATTTPTPATKKATGTTKVAATTTSLKPALRRKAERKDIGRAVDFIFDH